MEPKGSEILLRSKEIPSPRSYPRFQLFSLRPQANNFKKGKLWGSISVLDEYGSQSDEFESLGDPEYGQVTLFDHDTDCIDFIGSDVLHLGNPSSRFSVPFTSSVTLALNLLGTSVQEEDDDDNVYFEICIPDLELDFSSFLKRGKDSMCGVESVHGFRGYMDMFYILLRDAVDASMEVTFKMNDGDAGGIRVSGEILAYYGCGFLDKEADEELHDNYKAVLFRSSDAVLKPGRIQLSRSVMGVPAKGSLVIEVELKDYKSGEVILDGNIVLRPKNKGSSQCCLEWPVYECSLNLKVDWNY